MVYVFGFIHRDVMRLVILEGLMDELVVRDDFYQLRFVVLLQVLVIQVVPVLEVPKVFLALSCIKQIVRVFLSFWSLELIVLLVAEI